MEVTEFNLLNQHVPVGNGSAKPLISRSDMSADGVMLYFGLAVQGSATSEAKWTIKKYFYDANNNPSYDLVSARNQVWDNRTSGTYT